MDLSYGTAAESFREEIRSFLKAAWSPGERRNDELKAYVADFRISATNKGYLYRAIPKQYGGSQQPVDVIKAQVIREEFQRARAPMEIAGNGMNMTVPTLLEQGTEEQKELFIRKTMSGEYIWGQGYSEPGSGSDLASLKTAARLDGDEYVINGSKIWTTHAHHADWIFALVRTDATVKKQAGISFLLVPMDQPGVSVTPIHSMSGDHEVNAVFFTDARTPACNRIGEEGQGWTIAKFLLENERGGSCYAPRLLQSIDRLETLAQTQPSGVNGAIAHDARFRDKLARVRLEAEALEVTGLHSVAGLLAATALTLAAGTAAAYPPKDTDWVALEANAGAVIAAWDAMRFQYVRARSIASGTPSDRRTLSNRATRSPAPRPSAITSSGAGDCIARLNQTDSTDFPRRAMSSVKLVSKLSACSSRSTRCATKVPDPRFCTNWPVPTKPSTALRTVTRLRPVIAAMSRSGGRLSPGRNRPVATASAIRRCNCR